MGLHKTIKHQNNSKIPVLRLIVNAPWYVSNLTIPKDLQIPFAKEEIYRLSTLYQQSVLEHNNRLVAEISNPPNIRRRFAGTVAV
jgi:hypothetical protein